MSRHSQYEGLDIGEAEEPKGRGARFLKRTTALEARTNGELEEKTLHWVDPEACRMWDQHNRAYELLTEETCRDLIDGIRSQGRQEFPAIVRRTTGHAKPYEVICGARRHFAVSWLRANGYTQFRYLVEVRDLSDEEAFRLADIENRDREDISDYERATDYERALETHYGGSQKRMAERLEVKADWLSRYLALARLPREVVGAYASIRDLKVRHARDLGGFLKGGEARSEVMAGARALAARQEELRLHGEAPLDGAAVLSRLLKAGRGRARAGGPKATRYDGLTARRQGRRYIVELPTGASRAEARSWFDAFVEAELES